MYQRSAQSMFLLLLMIAPGVVASQQDGGELERIKRIKAAVARIGVGPGARVRFELRNLSRVKGFIQQADEEEFYVIVTEGGPIGTTLLVAYREIVKLSGRGLSLNFPEAASLQGGVGTWDSVRELERGEIVEVTLRSNRLVRGLLYGIHEQSVTVIVKGDAVVCRREEIVLLMRLNVNSSTLLGSVAGGTAKGVRASEKIAGVLSPIRGPISGEVGRGATPTGKALGAGIGAGAGLIKYWLKGRREKRVIVYAAQ